MGPACHTLPLSPLSHSSSLLFHSSSVSLTDRRRRETRSVSVHGEASVASDERRHGGAGGGRRTAAHGGGRRTAHRGDGRADAAGPSGQPSTWPSRPSSGDEESPGGEGAAARVCFTDSYRDGTSAVRYDFRPAPRDNRYRLGTRDVLHDALSFAVLLAMAMVDRNVVACFYPVESPVTRQLLAAVPMAAGAAGSFLFAMFRRRAAGADGRRREEQEGEGVRGQLDDAANAASRPAVPVVPVARVVLELLPVVREGDGAYCPQWISDRWPPDAARLSTTPVTPSAGHQLATPHLRERDREEEGKINREIERKVGKRERWESMTGGFHHFLLKKR
uniref:Uncharacterized protein n=1 Tax=Oryza meridionalis TaxID=40149 RepID=A0A0E0DN61_9ORYZ